jgi:hypothetical protein
MKKTRKIGRDAEKGLFIPVSVAQRRKKTAVVETIRIGKKRNKAERINALPYSLA